MFKYSQIKKNILLGKGLTFCPKTASHDKIILAEDIFKFSRRVRLKEYFADICEDNEDATEVGKQDRDTYKDLPFFNKKQSTFTPPAGRDVYLDFYECDVFVIEEMSSYVIFVIWLYM